MENHIVKTYKYRAFISYSHKDIKFARWLHKRIENYKIPKSLREKYPNLPKNLKRSIFRDEEELPISGSLPNNLTDALNSSEYLIVICSTDAAKSYWVDKEIRHFKSYHKNENVLAVIINGEPNVKENSAYDNALECFPEALKYKVDNQENLTNQRSEPIAGDARGFFKKRKVLIRIIAELLNVDFADLWKRDKREQKKRAILNTTFAVLFTGSVFFGYQNYIQKNEVKRQNIVLKKHSQEYVETLAQIKELENKLEKVNTNEEKSKLWQELEKKQKRLKILEEIDKSIAKLQTEVAKKAAEIFQKDGAKKALAFLNVAKIEEQEQKDKKIYAEIYRFKAQLYLLENDYTKAKEYFAKAVDRFFNSENAIEYANFLSDQNELKEAEKIYKKLLKEKLNSYEYAGTLNNLANLQEKLNQNQEALKNYKEALGIYRAFAKKNPNAFLPDVAQTLNNLANLQEKLNQNQEALKNYKEALKIRRALAKKNPNAFLPDVAQTLNNLANLQKKLNQNQEALKNYKEALGIYRALAKKNPNAFNYYVAGTLNNLALLQEKLNQNQEALKNYKEALGIYRALAKKNPNAFNYYVAITLNNLANLQEKLNQNQEALKNYNEALKIRKILALKNPDAYNSFVANTLNNLANLQAKLNQNQKALKNYNEASRIYKELAIKNSDAYNYYVALILNNLAALQYKLNQNQKALKNYNEASRIYKELAIKNPDTYNYYVAMTLNNLALLQNKLNKNQKALKNFKDALKLYKKLYNKTPNAYGLDYAKELFIGVYYFKEPKQNLKKAKKILLNYKSLLLAEELLGAIEQLEK